MTKTGEYANNFGKLFLIAAIFLGLAAAGCLQANNSGVTPTPASTPAPTASGGGPMGASVKVLNKTLGTQVSPPHIRFIDNNKLVFELTFDIALPSDCNETFGMSSINEIGSFPVNRVLGIKSMNSQQGKPCKATPVVLTLRITDSIYQTASNITVNLENDRKGVIQQVAFINLDGMFCGGFAAFRCPAGYECKLDGTYSDAGGKCVLKKEGEQLQNPPGGSKGNCTLMININTSEVGCFGCANGICKNPSSETIPYAPSESGIPYSCYVSPSGCSLAQ